MQKIVINFRNCYGISALAHEFEFDSKQLGGKSFAVYAPNGLMKTSFTKTFEKLSQGKFAEEERYNRPSTSEVFIDGAIASSKSIYVLKSEIDIQEESAAITDILVDPESKTHYDALLIDIDKQKNKVFNAVQKASGITKSQVEKIVTRDLEIPSFADCINKLLKQPDENKFALIPYNTLFDPKVAEVLKDAEFILNAKEFHTRYQELFEQADSIYQKGVFNPTKAEHSLTTLDKQGFFGSGHRVQMRGSPSSIGKEELEQLINKINEKIDADEKLKKIKSNLAKNAQTQALTDLIEQLSADQLESLLIQLKPENQRQLRLDLWAKYIRSTSDAQNFSDLYEKTRDEISAIELKAAEAAPRWTQAVTLFNDRFVDMPFTLSIANQSQAALGKEKARLIFTFKDGEDVVQWSRSEVKTLSQGEKRALFLLNLIFEVEARSQAGQDTIFIIDDVADSFDYKNKHAIIQYLEDLDSRDHCHQVILTHNFDFFRSLANNFVNRDKCLMANRTSNGITLSKAEGIKNYFTGILKEQIHTNPRIMCATIPFTRNLIEYTRGEKNPDYLKLTSLLHWKKDTDNITIEDYLLIYNNFFGTTHAGGKVLVKALMEEQAKFIANNNEQAGLNLEDKVLLSMAIRMKAEEYLIKEIRTSTGEANYWCESANQFGVLIKKFARLKPNSDALRTLEKVSVTVSSNIHLNSFMYEPILDLTISHLARLYNEVSELKLS